jgi:glycosyltransferase involved in cell wall biosynthesis
LNILTIHNRYLQRGGEDESSELENSLLREKGHNVIEHVADNHDLSRQFLVGVGIRSIWNQSSYTAIRNVIKAENIELVKIDNFFPQISPAVFYAAEAEGVATVQALRNFRLACPGAIFFRDGKICEDCTGKIFPWPGVMHGCYRNSRALTLAPAAMASVHRIAGTWRNHVSVYVALSEFSRDKFIEHGLPSQKIAVKPNFVRDNGIGDGAGRYALFVGRLSPEKGIDLLLSAWESIGSKLKLKIIGSGPLEDSVRECAAVNPAVEYLGRKSLAETYDYMGNAMALIFPSKWYETFGRTVAESFAKGTPVIASCIGTMKTMVTQGVTGLHFDPTRTETLVERVEWMLGNEEQWKKMREAARREYEARYTPQRNYEMMMEIFEKARTKRAGNQQ